MEKNSKTQNWNKVEEIGLIYKSSIKASERPVVKSSQEVYALLLLNWDRDTLDLFEEGKILLLNQANRVMSLYNLSKGGINGTVMDPKLIFTAALKRGACNIILSHNHPSGNLKPSKADEELTKKVKEAGSFLDIKVLDHIIITSEGYFSFADEGLI
jgi:DNA repair protein RadC